MARRKQELRRSGQLIQQLTEPGSQDLILTAWYYYMLDHVLAECSP